MANRVSLSIPSENLSISVLTSTLRLFELLITLRAVSPAGKLNPTWAILYQNFAQSRVLSALDRGPRYIWGLHLYAKDSGLIFQDIALDGSGGVESSLFESWVAAEFVDLDLLPIDEIKKGSYEFVLQTVNLLAVFGLQDISLVKDLVQWVCGSLKDLVSNNAGTERTVNSGNASVRISPDLIRALHHFDSVTLAEERTAEGSILKLKLLKRDEGLRR